MIMGKKITVKCSVCGSPHQAYSWRVARGMPTCCSFSCRGKRARSTQKCSNKKPIHGGCVGGKMSPLYRRWRGMLSRCHSKSSNKYPEYGARGITVCKLWRHNFTAFRDWAVSHGFSPNLQIDRKKNSLGYSPSNCRWVTCKQNQANRSRSIIFPGGLTTSEVATKLGISAGALRIRLYKGMTKKEAMSLPATPNGGARKWFKRHH